MQVMSNVTNPLVREHTMTLWEAGAARNGVKDAEGTAKRLVLDA